METTKIFKSINGEHKIMINIIDDVGYFKIEEINEEEIKLLLLLLKDIIEYMNEKKVKYIKQFIIEEDVEYFKNSCIDYMNDGTYRVTTKIEDFMLEEINVFGISRY